MTNVDESAELTVQKISKKLPFWKEFITDLQRNALIRTRTERAAAAIRVGFADGRAARRNPDVTAARVQLQGQFLRGVADLASHKVAAVIHVIGNGRQVGVVGVTAMRTGECLATAHVELHNAFGDSSVGGRDQDSAGGDRYAFHLEGEASAARDEDVGGNGPTKKRECWQ